MQTFFFGVIKIKSIKIVRDVIKLAFLVSVFYFLKKYYLSILETSWPWEKLQIINNNNTSRDIYDFPIFALSAANFFYISGPLILFSLIIYFNKKTTWTSEADDPLYKPTRFFFCSLIGIATLFNVLTPFNYYFNNAFLTERLMLFMCGCLFFWYPWILPLILLLILLWLRQQFFPLGYCSVLDKRLFYELPLFFLAYLLIPKKLKIGFRYVWIGTLAAISSNYYASGVGKIFLGPKLFSWIIENNLYVHFIFSHQFGWLHFLKTEIIQCISFFIEKTENFLCLFTVIVELSTVLIGKSYSLALAILSLLCVFHLGVFFESGIFFWKWICINFLIFIALQKYKKNFKNLFFGWFTFFAIAVLTIFSKKVFHPVELSWWDAKYNIRFEYFVELLDNKSVQISGHFFSPYEQYFTFQRLFGIVPAETKVVEIPFSNYLQYKKLQKITPCSIKEWRNQNSKVTFDPQEASVLNKFIKTFFENYNKHPYKNTISKIPWFPHLYKDKYAFNPNKIKGPVQKFEIYMVEESIEGIKPYETLREKVFSVSISNE